LAPQEDAPQIVAGRLDDLLVEVGRRDRAHGKRLEDLGGVEFRGAGHDATPARTTPSPGPAAARDRRSRSPSGASASRCWRAGQKAPTKWPGADAGRIYRPARERFL